MLDPWVYTVFDGNNGLYMVVACDATDVIEGLRRAGKPVRLPLLIDAVEREYDVIGVKVDREPEASEVPDKARITPRHDGRWAVEALAIDWAEHFEPRAPCLLRVTQSTAEIEPDGAPRVYKVHDGLDDTTYVVANHPARVLGGIEDWGEPSGDLLPVKIELVADDAMVDVVYDWLIEEGDVDVPDGATVEAPDPADEFGVHRVRATAAQWIEHFRGHTSESVSICSTRWA